MTGLAIIDFDGTLCSTHAAARHVIEQTYAHYGTAAPATDVINAAIKSGVPISGVFRMLGGAGDSDAWVKTYRTLYDAGQGIGLSTVYPGVERGLSQLKAAGFAVVILSNKGQSSLEGTLGYFGLADHVDLIIGDTGAFPVKPDRYAYDELILSRLSPPRDGATYVIGDTETDLLFARNISGKAVWARYGFGNRAACELLRPDFTIDRFDEFPSCLRAASATP